LVDQRPIDEVLEQHARVDPVRRPLRHEDADQVLLRVDPEARAPGAGPHRIAFRAGDPAHAVVKPDAETETKAITWSRGADRASAHPDRVLRKHELDALLGQVPLTVELAAVDHHLREAEIILGGADEAR